MDVPRLRGAGAHVAAGVRVVDVYPKNFLRRLEVEKFPPVSCHSSDVTDILTVTHLIN